MSIITRMFAIVSLILIGLYCIFTKPQDIVLVIMGGTTLGVALALISMEIRDALVSGDEQ